ncbi:MAG: hypothetical protein ABSG79_19710 [Bryobacteraceae bacterium]
MEDEQVMLDVRAGDLGKFRVRTDRTIYGQINGGGAEASFQTFNGRITLRKR